MKKQRAFTLVELLLVMALITGIASFSFPSFLSMKNKNDLDLAQTQALQLIRRAQILSRSASHDSNWGVKFDAHSIIVYCGNDYADRSTTLDETTTVPEDITFSGTAEVNFKKNSLLPYAPATIKISSSGEDKEILVNSRGVIDY